MHITQTYDETIEATIYSPQQLQAAIDRLASEIARDYAGKPITLLGVLKGALFVVVDLARALSRQESGPSAIVVDYLCVSSYGNATRSSGEIRMLKDTTEPVKGRHVIVVEDIVDNGLTLSYLQALLRERQPASLRSCVLFDKPYHRSVEVPVDYVGLQCPDEFVVGYGLDYQERFRNLPYLAQLRSWVFSKEG